MIIDYSNQVEIKFGTGDIEISKNIVSSKSEDNIGLIGFKNTEPSEIGTLLKLEKLHNPNDLPVILTFTKTKSIDVLIESLSKVKELMIINSLEKSFKDTFMLICGIDGEYEDGDFYKLDRDGEKEYISKWSQYKSLQRFAFALEDNKIYISQSFAIYLTNKYNDLMMDVETEDERDLSGDYMIDFDRWVKGVESPIYWT